MGIRPQFSIRDARVEDSTALVDLLSRCVETTSDSGFEAISYQSLWRHPDAEQSRASLADNLSRSTRRILVAEHDEQIVGVVVGDVSTLTPVTTTRVLLISDAQVSPDFRRRGVISGLLSAMAAHGEECGCEITVMMASAHAKEPNRYLTKIGFNQVAIMRAISTGKLRARLSRDTDGDTGRLVAVRRTLRRRQAAARAVG